MADVLDEQFDGDQQEESRSEDANVVDDVITDGEENRDEYQCK